ncbi:DUF2922 domain-containing protein|uniref:DUF2922 domain-containing protein n=1 Tax=Dendrosporobacter quercicolus TaxID=146817 RepID=A0A1G9WS89_9FIRM|nr:DUF2922 domain-containing protein [Dendrosporobacter quercicolus]NSL49201.1 DUF2922 domain-containing protein [Dendrosporobacter quercicolus DSM 1736]SDM87464.1 Protein of unknown function [Dendrosporobacter quercicolus]
MTKTLELVFQSAAGKEVTLNLADPQEGLTKAVVDAVMAEIISRNIFITATGELTQIVEARIKTTEAVVLA